MSSENPGIGINVPLLDTEDTFGAVMHANKLVELQEAELQSNPPESSHGYQHTVVELFERQSERTPKKIAVVFEGEELTYHELNLRANRLAAYLCEQGVEPETLVGLCVDRSVTMLVALLGILKAGGAYVPLDPDFPRERLRFMLQDSGAQVVVTEQKFVETLSVPDLRLICLDTESRKLRVKNEKSPRLPAGPENLAHVIYTSGSTGRPKGAMIQHSSLLNLLQSMAEEMRIESSDVLLAVATISFDIAGLELLMPLITGATVVIASRAVARDPKRLAQSLEESKATVMQATPATWRMLVQSGWTGQRNLKILSGGEMLSRDLANALLDRAASVWNAYGPTETTIYSTVGRARKEAGPASVSIGRPIANTQVYILDDSGEPVSLGASGEIYIGGDGLARGYWNQPELTRQRFVESRFGPPGSRLYRSGDQGRFLPDGTVECLGRTDDQVKIRGYRVELGEIEAVLRQDPAVRDTVVVVRNTESGESQLVAFVVPSSADKLPDGNTLRAMLQTILPEYMIPAVFVNIAELPLTPNGKIDRRALATPGAINIALDKKFVFPRNDLEQKLVEIFERVLGVRPISVTGNFFSLGGHSLLAVKLFSEIAKFSGTKLPPSTVFQAPTVELLAAVLVDQGVGQTWSPLVPIKTSGSLPPFFCVHPRGSNLVRYHLLANLLGPDQPFYGFQSTALDEKRAARVRIEEMAAEYIEEIRKIQPRGPYNIGGWSFGGTVAFEIAQQLRSKGESVGLLALIDTFYPVKPEHYPTQGSPRTLSWKFDRYSGEFLFLMRGRRVKYLFRLLKDLFGIGTASAKRFVNRKLKREDPIAKALSDIERAHARAEREYVPRPYPGRVVMFWCSHWSFRVFQDFRLAWSNVAGGGLEVYVVPGNHKTMWELPNVAVFVERMKHCLQLSHNSGAHSAHTEVADLQS